MATHAKKSDAEITAMVDEWIGVAITGQWRIRTATVYESGDVLAQILGRRRVEIIAGRRLHAMGWRRVRAAVDGARGWWYVRPGAWNST